MADTRDELEIRPVYELLRDGPVELSVLVRAQPPTERVAFALRVLYAVHLGYFTLEKTEREGGEHVHLVSINQLVEE